MSDLLLNLRKELQTKIEPDFREGFINFFKEKVKPLGIRSRHLQIITRNYRKFLPKEKKDFFHLLQKILSADWHEEIYIAFKWLFLRRKELVKKDFSFLEQCLKKHITNWAHCDDFSTHPLGYLLYTYPELYLKTKIWLRSSNRWLRRAAAVSLIYAMKQAKKDKIKNQKYLTLSFSYATALMKDPDDLVQKAYGWLLKEASNVYPAEVFAYVLKNKKDMTRTALRYAIEKMPFEFRKKALS